MKNSALLSVAIGVAALSCAFAKDYTTTGRIDYTSQTSDLAAILGEVPEGPFTWTHSGGAVNMYAGGLLQSLDDLANLNPARLTLTDATVTLNSAVTVASAGTVDGAEVGGSGELILDNTKMAVYAAFNVNGGNVLGGDKAQHPIVGRLVLKNNSKLWVKDILSISANASKGAEWNAQVTNEIVISSGSILSPFWDIQRYDGPSGKIVFDGGILEKPWDSMTHFFGAKAWGYDGKSALLVTSTPGNDVVLSCNHTNELFSTQNTGYLLTDGAIRKLGRGQLRFNGPSGNTGYFDRLAFHGLSIDEGSVQLYNNFTFPNDRERGTLTIAAGAQLDLNNNAAIIKSLAGSGMIHASDANGVAVTLDPTEDITSKVKLGPGITTLTKRGETRAEVSALGMANSATKVDAGTLAFVDPQYAAGGYTHYRFRVTAVNDSGNAKQIMELREIRLFEGENDVTFAKEFKYDKTTTQTGGTGIFGNNELPEKAMDTNLTTKWCDLRYADQDCWWIEFVYDYPVQVTSYNWAKTDNLYRSPRSWQLEGSNDGESWTVLDERTMDTRYLPRDQWVSETPFAVAAAAPARTETLGALSVSTGAVLDLSASTAAFTATASSSLAGTVKLPTNGALTLVCDEDVVLPATSFEGHGSVLLKDGPGKLTLMGALSAGVSVEVLAGELAFEPAAFEGKFFRFTVKAIRNENNKDGGKTMSLGKFHLFDADGNAVNENLAWFGGNPTGNNWKNDSDGTAAKNLTPGTFSQAGFYQYSIWNGAHEAPYWIFYPASDTHKWTTLNHIFDSEDASTWYTVNMRLTDDANPVVSYNLRTAPGGDNENRSISAWMLEGSTDGENWVRLDERSLGLSAPSTGSTWYNDGVPYSLDLSSDRADFPTLAALTVDCVPDAAQGTLAYFNPAEAGVLNLIVPDGVTLKNVELPLTITESSSTAKEALKGWTVTVNGQPLLNGTVTLKNNKLIVNPSLGFVISIR